MNKPTLQIADDKLAYSELSSAFLKKAWVMDPPPWIAISDRIRVDIYKNQLKSRIQLLELEMQSLKIETEMLNKSLQLIK